MNTLKPNAETYRLTALAKLMSGDLAQARIEISKAKELAPTWEGIKHVQAVIDYYGTLVESAVPRGLMAWPLPIDEALVKVDSITIARLREAQQVFAELSQKSQTDIEEKKNLEAWHIATLFNDPAKKADLVKHCKILLENDPTHYRVILWVLTRNLEIDLSVSTKSLRISAKGGKAETMEIIALAGCLLRQLRAKEAIELLKTSRRSFRTQQDRQTRILWLVRSYLQLPKTADSIRGLNSLKTTRGLGGLKEMVDEAILTKRGDWKSLVKRFDRRYQRSKEPRYLFEACELSGRHKDWKYVAGHATELVQLFQTPQSIRLASISAYNVQQFSLCLRILDENLSVFLNRQLPTELRRLRIQTLQVLGVLTEALVDAEQLLRDDPTIENHLALGQILFNLGDLKGVASIAQKLVTNPELSTIDSLRLAKAIFSEDSALSKRLWRQAVSKSISNDLLGLAITQAFQLGLEDEARALLERMAELGKKGQAGFRQASLDEMVEEMKKRGNESIRIREMHERGEIPIHLMVDALNLSLINYFHDLPESNLVASNPLNRYPLFVRHGGRTATARLLESQKAPRLNLDVTSVLLYEQLGILDRVEKVFAPLRIPDSLFQTLVILKDKLFPIQPSELEASLKIKNFVETKKIKCVDTGTLPKGSDLELMSEMGDGWGSLLEEVFRDDGYLVDYLPLQKINRTGALTTLAKDKVELIVDIRAVVDSLRMNGPLSEAEFQHALYLLGSNGTSSLSHTIPVQAKPLHIANNIPGVLAKAGILDAVCDRFKVSIELQYFEGITSTLRQNEQNQKAVRWLGDLISRLHSGVKEGIYQFIPADQASVAQLKPQGEAGTVARSILSLLSFKLSEEDVICVDDRNISSYLFRENRPIVTLYEIVRELFSRNLLTEDEFREIVMRMREFRLCFLHLEKEELIYHIKNARTSNGSLIETNELITLRQYFADCFVRGKTLQKPKVIDQQQSFGEIHFLLNYARKIADSMVSLWEVSSYSETNTKPQAEWILTNLFVDNLALFKACGMLAEDANEQYVMAIGFASLLSSAFSLGSGSVKGSGQRRLYIDWLNDRFLAKRFRADRLLVAATADALKRSMTSILMSEEEKIPKEIPVMLVQEFYDDLPEQLKSEIAKDSGFLSTMGYAARATTQLLGHRFDVDDFYSAATLAINGGIGKVKTWDSEKEMEFHPSERQEGFAAFRAFDATSGTSVVIANEFNDLLNESAIDREAYLLKREDWFDHSSKIQQAAGKEIAGLENAAQRVERARLWQAKSMNIFYRNLFVKIRDTGQSRNEDLVPDTIEPLTDFLRISGTEFTSFDASASTLMAEVGLLETIKRLACLPNELPQVVHKTIMLLSESEFRDLVKKLLRTYGSPIARLHFLKILIEDTHLIEVNRRLARRIVMKILDRPSHDFEAFKSMLMWVEEELAGLTGFRDLPTWQQVSCVWVHTNNVFSVLRSLDVPTDWISGRFGMPRVTHLAFDRGEYWYDVAHSRELTRELFVVSGLSYALSISADYVLGEKAKIEIKNLVFGEISEAGSLNPRFLSNRSLSLNSTRSFLANEITEILSKVIDPKIAIELSSANLLNVASNALIDIEKNPLDKNGWAFLHAVLGDLPLTAELAKRTASLVDLVDYSKMFQSDPESAGFALLFITQHVGHFMDEGIKSRLENQLIAIARCFASGICVAKDDNSEIGRLARPDITLVQAAQNLSVTVSGFEARVQEFSRIMLRLADVWPNVLVSAKPIFELLVEELPMVQAQHLWPLVFRGRAVL